MSIYHIHTRYARHAQQTGAYLRRICAHVYVCVVSIYTPDSPDVPQNENKETRTCTSVGMCVRVSAGIAKVFNLKEQHTCKHAYTQM